MNAIDQLLSAQNIVNAKAATAAERINPDLLGSAHICEALDKVFSFAQDLKVLPGAIAKLKAEMVSIEARNPLRLEAIRKAKHEIATLEAPLKKLNGSLEHNLAHLGSETASPTPLAQAIGAKLPATRQERVDQLRQEIAAVVASTAGPREDFKKAVRLLKSDTTRLKNLPGQIEETERKLQVRLDQTPEMTAQAKKTAVHVKNRREHLSRKAAERQAKQPAVVETPVAEAPKAPTDEDLRRKAEEFFGTIVTDEQLNELRGDHEFLSA